MVVGLFGSSANWGRLEEQAGDPGLQTPPGHAVLWRSVNAGIRGQDGRWGCPGAPVNHTRTAAGDVPGERHSRLGSCSCRDQQTIRHRRMGEVGIAAVGVEVVAKTETDREVRLVLGPQRSSTNAP